MQIASACVVRWRDTAAASRAAGNPIRRLQRWSLGALLLLTVASANAAITRVAASSEYFARTNDRVMSIVAAPAGMAANDLMLLVLSVSGPSLTGVTVPTGWQVVSQSINSGHSQLVYRKVALLGESGPYNLSWTFPGSAAGNDRTVANIVAYRGVDTVAPIAAAGAQFEPTVGDTVDAPSITPGTVDTRLVGFFGLDRSGGAPVTVAGMAAFGGPYESGAGPGGITLAVVDEAWPGPGATGTRSGVFNQSARRNGQLLALRPIPVLDHIRILHSGSALTCEPATITLRACADASCSLESPQPVTVTLSPAGGWSSNPVSFTGSTTVTLSVTSATTVTLGASSNPAAPNATQCYAGATPTCDLLFAATGFIFSSIPSQIAGTASAAITLRAVRTSDDTSACTAALPAGNHVIDLASQCINPTICAGRQVAIDATPIANNPASGVSAYTAVSLAFDANASASFSLNYPDVGALQLHARHTVPNGALLTGSSNSFVVRPAGFVISAIERVADSFSNPGATLATGPIFIGAGQPFRATVTAVTSTNVATPNFGREITPESVLLTRALLLPVGGNEPALANPAIAAAAFSAGSATVNNLAWPEVGIITLSAAVADGDYLGSGAVAGPATGPVGRFVPDHFDVTVAPACLASGITYSRQPFVATVFARPVCGPCGGVVTQNYAGDFARDTTLSDAAVPVLVPGTFTGNVISAADFALGVAITPVPSDPAALSFAFDAAEQGPETLTVRATDSDGISSAGSDGSTAMRSARLRLINVVGSELQDLNMPIKIESWGPVTASPDPSAWLVDVTDACTTLAATDFTVTGGFTAVNNVTPFTNGEGTLTLDAAPGFAGQSADVTGVLDDAPPLAPWLQFDWNGDGTRDNPTARAGFGLNPGSDQQIFRREVVGG